MLLLNPSVWTHRSHPSLPHLAARSLSGMKQDDADASASSVAEHCPQTAENQFGFTNLTPRETRRRIRLLSRQPDQPKNNVGLVRPAASCCFPSRRRPHPRNTSPSPLEDHNPRSPGDQSHGNDALHDDLAIDRSNPRVRKSGRF